MAGASPETQLASLLALPCLMVQVMRSARCWAWTHFEEALGDFSQSHRGEEGRVGRSGEVGSGDCREGRLKGEEGGAGPREDVWSL